ncbi:MAG TPA: DUF4105 domain-containing protein [Polyangiales bacterium]|nr:DUF4105 domain-containing protein [Polyangiales bacterium]
MAILVLRFGLFALPFLLLAACGHGRLGTREIRAPGPPDPYVEALLGRARALKLAEHPQWRKLLHYRLGVMGEGFLGGGYTSEADGANFFMSERGKVDPEGELEATLRGLFLPLSATSSKADPDDHPLCRFPARFLFLSSALGIDPLRLPVQRCPRAEKFMRELDPGSLTLIFSSYYLNNPASAFGHTFLRINKRNTLAVGERRELLDFGIDYSADVDTGNAVIYAIKGLTGMFPGTFKRIPYYYKVRAYNDYESRDLWEYELDLTAAQLTLLSAHLWELGQTYFEYYYLSENCSYHILSLIEVANPELQLLDEIVSPVIPADTVKALYKYPGLVRRVSYRPSLRSQFNARVEKLDSEQRSLVEELAADADYPLPAALGPARSIAVLDAAADLFDVLYARELVHKTDNAASLHKQRLLERRAAILAPSESLTIEPPLGERPELGHGSRRFGLGAATSDGSWAPSFDVRLALHDLGDPTPGYPELNAIEFMRLRVQFWAPSRFELEDASFVRITSLTPQSRFDRKISWEFDLGGTTIDDAACDHCLMAHVSGGAGLAFDVFDKALTLYALGYGTFGWAPDIAGFYDSGLRMGVGPAGGLRVRLTKGLIALGTARWLWLPKQAPDSTYRIDAQLRLQPLRELSIGVEGRYTPNGIEAQGLAYAYF